MRSGLKNWLGQESQRYAIPPLHHHLVTFPTFQLLVVLNGITKYVPLIILADALYRLEQLCYPERNNGGHLRDIYHRNAEGT